MIVARPGWSQPLPGQTVYVLLKNEVPVGATLRATSAMRCYRDESVDDFVEVEWIE